MAINLASSESDMANSQIMSEWVNSHYPKDLVLACSEGHCLKARSFTLACFSPYFYKVFQVLAVCKQKKSTLLLPDVSVSVMKILLQFMDTCNVQVEKDLIPKLVEANKLLHIYALDDVLYKHIKSSLPPNKKQCIEGPGSLQVSVNPSSVFRPWDSPVLTTPSLNTIPMFSKSNDFSVMGQSVPNSTMACSLPYGNNLLSETAPLLPETASISKHVDKRLPEMAPLLPETASLPKHVDKCLSETVPLLPVKASLPKKVRKPRVKMAPSSIVAPYHQILRETNLTLPEAILPHTKTKKPNATKIKSKEKTNGDVMNNDKPGKQRCDICSGVFNNITGHKKTAHGILKTPIECCGKMFLMEQTLKNHKKTACNYRKSQCKN